MNGTIDKVRSRHASARRTLASVGPENTLARGYAILTEADGGAVIREAGSQAIGNAVRARLAQGELTLTVTAVQKD